MTAITYRKTQSGEWVAFGPAAALKAGATVQVTKRSGEVKTETIARVGRPFTANGQQMAYGYLDTAAPAASFQIRNGRQVRTGGRSSRNAERCAECRRNLPATHVRYDRSGEEILLCAVCAA